MKHESQISVEERIPNGTNGVRDVTAQSSAAEDGFGSIARSQSTQTATLDAVEIAKLIREELDRNNSYLSFAQGQSVKIEAFISICSQ
jgi:hypothetical protein